MSETYDLNRRSAEVCQHVEANCEALDVQVLKTTAGATILDFGTDRKGQVEGGIQLANVCMAGLATIEKITSPIEEFPYAFIAVETDSPLLACIGAQYAGWPFSTENVFAMCSGPARMNRGGEDILTQFGLTSDEEQVVGILESNRLPNDQDIIEFAEECECELDGVIICIARTCSMPGTIQVVSRSVETAMHKLFEIGFDLSKVKKAIGSAPICPLGRDDYQAMGWTNDAILYGGDVELWVEDVDDIHELARQLPSSSSVEYGRPFIEIFESYDRDFYKVDRMLFSPAKVSIHCLGSGQTATAGEIRTDLLIESFRARA